MAGEDLMVETTVSERYAVTLPKAIRDRLDVEPGDTLRWTVTDDELAVEVTKQRTGALEGFEPVGMGSRDAADDHDVSAVESDERFE